MMHSDGAPSGTVIGMANRLAKQVADLVEERARLREELQAAKSGVETLLCGTIDGFHVKLGEHGRRVAALVDALAAHLKIPSAGHKWVRDAALHHDWGMLALERATLFTPWSELAEADRALVLRHPDAGAAQLGSLRWLEPSVSIIAAHHEHWDGSGYPRHLARDNIPVGARILAVCDTFDELRHQPFGHGEVLDEDQARDYLLRHRGSRFDPKVVDAFVSMLERHPPGDVRSNCGEEAALTLPQLQAGMQLARDMLNVDGLVMLAKGFVLQDSQLQRLRRLFGGQAVVEPVYVVACDAQEPPACAESCAAGLGASAGRLDPDQRT